MGVKFLMEEFSPQYVFELIFTGMGMLAMVTCGIVFSLMPGVIFHCVALPFRRRFNWPLCFFLSLLIWAMLFAVGLASSRYLGFSAGLFAPD